MNKKYIAIQNDHPLVVKISELIEASRKKVAVAVNLSMVYTYFEIGRMIVEDEQKGEKRAEYGKTILSHLSIKLTEKYGKGFSEQNLRNMRQFYQVYSDRTIWQKPSAKSWIESKNAAPIRQKPSSEFSSFTLSWSHYLVLMRIENPDERRFYEIEAQKQHWSEPQLKRQFHSSLYERLALSRNKKEVLKLAQKGQGIEKATDFLKNPLTLEFLGLKDNSAYSENDLESAIISKLQLFLLELGKGFLFEARQKRFTFDNDHFFVDLVFYNRLLQCYVLIDLKTDKLLHQDLGQMQMYVNYFDRYEKKEFEKPTVGILLCKKKNDALVELTLPKNSNIYASEYSLYLPDKALLQRKLAQWIEEFEQGVEGRRPEKESKRRLAGLKYGK
jgi:predicted nuclease of restriction endonuclease-like (RecB) superfamily